MTAQGWFPTYLLQTNQFMHFLRKGHREILFPYTKKKILKMFFEEGLTPSFSEEEIEI